MSDNISWEKLFFVLETYDQSLNLFFFPEKEEYGHKLRTLINYEVGPTYIIIIYTSIIQNICSTVHHINITSIAIMVWRFIETLKFYLQVINYSNLIWSQ